MLSGYVKNQQELIDIINGCLFNKTGVLDLFSIKTSLSIYIENGFIFGFFVEDIKDLLNEDKNEEALLLFYMAEILNAPFAFFSFREEFKDELFIQLKQRINVEELILQTQLVSVELRALLEKIITPYAILKAQEVFPEIEVFDGKSVYQIIATSKSGIIDTLRKIRNLIDKGFLDIHQFYYPFDEKKNPKVNVIMQSIEAGKLKLISIMQNLVLSKFSGFLRINLNGETVYIYYTKGKPVALFPINYPIFDFLIDIKGDAKVSVIELDEKTTKLLMLRHSENKVITGVTDNFVELGKVLMGISIESKSGIVVVRYSGNEHYILYENGKVFTFLKEGREGLIEIISDLEVKHPYWVDVIFFDHIENMDKVVYLFLINVVYSILLKSGNYHIINSVKNYIASSENFKHEEGQIKYREIPKNPEDILAFLYFLLDLSYKIFGEKKLEEELEQFLRPYKDVIEVLRVQEYINFLLRTGEI